MIYAGIDYSTHAVDVVTVSEHPHQLILGRIGQPMPTTVQHHRVEFFGDNAWARAFDAAGKLKYPYHEPAYDAFNSLCQSDVIVIEEPAGSSRLVAQQLARVQGIILANLPRIDGQVWGMVPPEWKKLTVGKGNASKNDVKRWVLKAKGTPDFLLDQNIIEVGWEQDAYDAYALAIAGKVRRNGPKV